MYTPKDLKNEGQHIFFKLLSFVIYTNLLYVVLLFLTVMLYAKITGEYSSVESIINQLDTRFFTILNEISVTIIGIGLFYRNKEFLIQEFKTVNRHFSTINFILYLFLLVCFSILGTGILHFSSINLEGYFNTINGKSPLSLIFIIVIAPVIEEILFRGVVLKPLEKYGKLLAIVISSLLFAIYHGNIIHGIYAFICGLLLGFVASEYSLKYSVILHIFNNLISTIIENKPFTELYKNHFANTSVMIISAFFAVWYILEKYPVLKNYSKVNRPIFEGEYRICLLSLPVILFAVICLLPIFI